MSFFSRTAAALVALNAASVFAATTTASSSSSSLSYVPLYSYSLQIPVNVNPTYETVQDSTTKWIGKNTKYLTDEIVTSTTSGKASTTTKEIGAGVSSTTATASGSTVPALGITLSPETVSELENIAVAACGGSSKKRDGACALSADALGAQLEGTIYRAMSAADLATLEAATVDGLAGVSAASVIVATIYLSAKAIPMNVGINLPKLKAAASSQAAKSSTSSSSSSKVTGTTITNAIDQYLPVDTDTAALASQGSFIIAQARNTPNPFLAGTGQTFSCSNFADPHNTMTLPNDYCVCQDSKKYPTTSGPSPCPYTAAPKSTVVFTTKTSSTSSKTSTSTSTGATPAGTIMVIWDTPPVSGNVFYDFYNAPPNFSSSLDNDCGNGVALPLNPIAEPNDPKYPDGVPKNRPATMTRTAPGAIETTFNITGRKDCSYSENTLGAGYVSCKSGGGNPFPCSKPSDAQVSAIANGGKCANGYESRRLVMVCGYNSS